MAKKGTAASPLEALLKGVVKFGPHDELTHLFPFTELIEQGWTIRASKTPPYGVVREQKLMIVPTDGSPESLFTRAHEQAHIVWTPDEPFDKLAEKAEIPTGILNAFEDGRINGRLTDRVELVADLMASLPFPIDAGRLERNVAEMPRGHDAPSLRDAEAQQRLLGACLMAASEAYARTDERTERWLAVGRACGMNEAHVEEVARVCRALPGMEWEQMVEEIKKLVDVTADPEFGAQSLPGEGDGEESGDGDPCDEGETRDMRIENQDGEKERAEGGIATTRTMSPEKVTSTTYLPKGVDHKKSAPVAVYKAPAESSTVTPVALPPKRHEPAKRLTAAARMRLMSGASAAETYVHPATYTWQAEEKMLGRSALEIGREQQSLQEITPNLGVTEKHENAIVRAFGGRGDREPPICPMKKLKRELTLDAEADPHGPPPKRRKPDRVGYLSHAFRASVDGKVFRRKQRTRKPVRAGSVLIDCSGSMNPSSEAIAECLRIAPYAVIGAYAGDDVGSGSMCIVAEGGKYMDQKSLSRLIREMGGGNSVDLPALMWLAEQPPPRIWISDGWACGTPNDAAHVHGCFQLCRREGIVRIRTLEMLLGKDPLIDNIEVM